MRLAGFVCIVLAGGLLGMRSARIVRNRAEALRSLASACTLIASVIPTGRMKPGEVIHRLAAQSGGASCFFQEVGQHMCTGLTPWDAWQTAAKHTAAALGLTKNELDELETVGRALTCFGGDAARQTAEASAELFRTWADSAIATQKQDARLRQSLWLTAALLIGILLI